jgi:hypothetical protein
MTTTERQGRRVGCGLLVGVCTLGLRTSANAQMPEHGGASLSAQCGWPVCVGSALDCFVDVMRNDECGDAIQLLAAYAMVDNCPAGPPFTRVPATGNLLILAAWGNTTAVPGPFNEPVYIGPPGDTNFGLPGINAEGMVRFGMNPNDPTYTVIITTCDPTPLLTIFAIDWMDMCDDFNHEPDCTDCPAGVAFSTTTGAATEVAESPTGTIEPPNPCLGDEICAVASGGTPPYTYLWSTGETTACVTPPSAGEYCVVITDGNGCTSPPCCISLAIGDLNCDGTVSFADINPFVLYLSDSAAWQSAYPDCPLTNGDINCDGTYGQWSFDDINPFVALLSGT